MQPGRQDFWCGLLELGGRVHRYNQFLLRQKDIRRLGKQLRPGETLPAFPGGSVKRAGSLGGVWTECQLKIPPGAGRRIHPQSVDIDGDYSIESKASLLLLGRRSRFQSCLAGG